MSKTRRSSSLIVARVAGDPLPLLRKPLKAVSILMVGIVQSQFCRCSSFGRFSGGPRILSLRALFLSQLAGKSLSPLSLTCFHSSQEMPGTCVFLPCEVTVEVRLSLHSPAVFPHSPLRCPSSARHGEVQVSGRMTGVCSCFSLRHLLSELEGIQSQAASR